MKLLIAALLVCLVACSNPSQRSNLKNNLLGKWQMTEQFIDIGDGNGKWQKENPSDPSTLEFTENKIIRNARDTFSYIWNDNASYYQLLKNGDSVSFTYEFHADTLQIKPPCIEGCGEKYIRIKN